MRANSPALFLVAAAILCTIANAGGGAPPLTPIAQQRSVSAHATASGDTTSDVDSDSDAAVDFGPFSGSVSVNAVAWAPVCGGQAAASQESTIAGDGIHGSGEVTYSGYVTGNGNADVGISVWSRVEVTFTLDRPSDYTLQGALNCSELFGSCWLDLLGPDGHVHDLGSGWQDTVVNESGTLAAGEYTVDLGVGINLGLGGFAIEEDGLADFDFVLDFSGNGAGEPGGEVPGLTVARLPGDLVRLAWAPSCRVADDDYAVYEGSLEEPLGLEPVICTTGGLVEHAFTPAHDAAFILVVPHDGTTEGSYGKTSGSVERPPSAVACRPQLLSAPVCP
jgi:hypothetical protein